MSIQFTSPYDPQSVLNFLENEFLPDDFTEHMESLEIEFKPLYIQTAKLLGDCPSLELKVFEIQHQSENDPRVGVSKDLFRLMSLYRTKRAVAILTSSKSENYRLSLATIDFVWEGKKITKEYSNPRRYSFYLGPDCKEHTPYEFLIKKGRIKDFDDLLQRFSIEVVNNEFYHKIANWYFWAIKEARFPEDAEKEPNGRQMVVIRMITRIIFIWFMKVRKLVPEDLFEEKKVREILKDMKPGSSTYYQAILQNLFFATLNTKQEERRYRAEERGNKGYNEDFGNHNVFRHHDLVKNPDSFLQLFSKIPFLNGGLFECLDYKSKTKEERCYIDGFTDNKKFRPEVPNTLFFANEKNADLNRDYGTTNKTYKVSGLLNILSLYNFTIDENKPNDVEVALDPEMLGLVFEKLLATYNPETATTARKSTGSYYTPRPIVEYMAEESIKEYLKTHIQSKESVDEKINMLFSRENSVNPFDKPMTQQLIHLIDNLRVVDPAVGSGAFPMGILNKLVFLLSKLDPDNRLWKQSQIDSVHKNVKDSVLQRQLTKLIEKRFTEKNADYGRKLYLIEKCIYGVDIQQIAVEIAKLRFFISLLVDEQIDFDKPNYCIEPLPNMDFKLMQGNSLISSFAGIDFSQKDHEPDNSLFLHDKKFHQLIIEYEELKSQYQSASGKNEKDSLKEEIEKKLLKVFEEKINSHYPQLKDINAQARAIKNEKQRQEYVQKKRNSLTKKIGFDLEQAEKDLIAFTEGRKPKDFFLWDIYFAEVFSEKGGFDIVIGNPPYVDSETMTRDTPEYRELLKAKYKCAKGNWDLFVVFVEKGIDLCRIKGHLSFIISNKLISAKYTYALREHMNSKSIKELIDYSNVDVFKSADVYPIVFIIQNSISINHHVKTKVMASLENIKNQFLIPSNKFHNDIFWDKYFFDEKILKIIFKLSDNQKLQEEFPEIIGAATVDEAYKIKTKIKEIQNEKKYFKFINTGTIDPYASLWGIKATHYIKNSYNKPIIICDDLKKINPIRSSQSESTKIIIAGMALRIEAFYDEGVYCAGKSTTIILGAPSELKPLIGILNSRLVSFWFSKYFNSLSMAGGYFNIGNNEIGLIPLPNIKLRSCLNKNVENIISFKQKNPQADTSVLEHQIDVMVYKLYELTYDEVKIIDPEFGLSREEWEKVKVD